MPRCILLRFLSASGIDFGACKDRRDGDASGLDGLLPTFATIHQNEREGDRAAPGTHFLNGLKSGSAGSDRIIDHNHRVPSFEISFDQPATAVRLRLFANGKYLEIGTRPGSFYANGKGHGISSHREAANASRSDTELMGPVANQLPSHFAKTNRSLRIQSRQSGIAIEVTLFAGSEREVAIHDGLATKDFEQLLTGVGHAPA